jgi:hypothetical protein
MRYPSISPSLSPAPTLPPIPPKVPAAGKPTGGTAPEPLEYASLQNAESAVER